VRLLLRDSEEAARQGVEGNLWRLCFYKKIEEFRRALARGHEQLQDPAKCLAAEQVLAATKHDFGRFLDKTSALYLALLQKAAQACALAIPGYGRAPEAAWPASLDVEVDAASLSEAQQEAMVGTCYRSLIYLGDLERYRGTYLHNMATYDWTSAERHYRTALLLRPHAGNPHNQCGVIANYSSDDLSGLFHYARSILCDDPYLPQGRANLEMLLRKNRDTLLTDSASNSQQRRRLEKDATLRAIVGGRWFVRPLGLLCLLAGQEHVKLAEEDAFTRLPALLDADRQPSDLCLKMVCACIFAVTDLERQLRSADEHVHVHADDGLPADPEALRTSYQLALEFTFNVALMLMRSAKATQHHLQAVSVLSVWLLQHPHLLSPQKSVDSVCYDCERLRRAQGSFAEGLVDLINLNLASLRHTTLDSGRGASLDALSGGKLLPEDVLLAGWAPLRGQLEPLLQARCEERKPQRMLLLGLRAVEDKGELFKVRLERIMALARVLAQGPGPILCLNPSSGELSVEGLGGARTRTKQAPTPVVAVGSSQALPQQLVLGQAKAAHLHMHVAQEAVKAPAVGQEPVNAPAPGMPGNSTKSRGSGDASERAPACGECGAVGQPGRVDEFDSIFYCDTCWDNLEALDALGAVDQAGDAENDAHSGLGHASSTAVGVLGETETSSILAGAAPEESVEWQKDDEAFGPASLAVDCSGMAGSLDGLAQQAALFAAASRSPRHLAGLTAGHSLLSDQGQGPEDAGDGYLEHLVQCMVGNCDRMDTSGGDARKFAAPVDEDSMDGEDIVFQPRSQATHGNGAPETDVGAGAKNVGAPAVSSLGGLAASRHAGWSNMVDAGATAADGMMFETSESLLPGQSMWGGFGTGPCGFGSSDAFATKGSLESLGSSNRVEGDWGMEGARQCREPVSSSSRFSTRNPFAN